MGLKQTGRTHAPSELHFRYTGTPLGATWHAWIAGPPQWFWCHTMHRTKPCVKELTGGQVECSNCGQKRAAQKVGYLGVYREVDARPILVVLHEEQLERADALQLHQRVMIGREDNKADGVWVAPALKATPLYQTTLAERMNEADLTETLLRVWAIPELVEWYRREEKKTPAKKFTPKPGGYQTPPATDERTTEVNKRFAAACKRAPGGRALPESLEEILPIPLGGVSKNGKH